MSERGTMWRSCYACGGKLFDLSGGLLFCSNEHCQRGGRVMSLKETSDQPGSAQSTCILDECLLHGKGRYADDGNRNGGAGQIAVPVEAGRPARKVRRRRKAS